MLRTTLRSSLRFLSSTPSAPKPSIVLEKMENKVFHLILNNIDSRNALSTALLNHLEAAANRANNHDEIRALVMYSCSPKAFCAGADLKQRRTMTPSEVIETVNRTRKIFNLFSKVSVPTFALIDGHCLGGGLELALAADFRIATKKASMGVPEVGLGIIPG